MSCKIWNSLTIQNYKKNYSSLHGKNDPYGSKKRRKRCKQKVEPEQSRNLASVIIASTWRLLNTVQISLNVYVLIAIITLLVSFAHPRHLKVVIGNVLDL